MKTRSSFALALSTTLLCLNPLSAVAEGADAARYEVVF